MLLGVGGDGGVCRAVKSGLASEGHSELRRSGIVAGGAISAADLKAYMVSPKPQMRRVA